MDIRNNRPKTPLPQLKPAPILGGNKKKKLWPILVGVVGIVGVSTGVILALRSSQPGNSSSVTNNSSTQPTESPSPTPTPTPSQLPSLLNGVIGPSALATRHPLSIMIENHPDARPQSGLSAASVVYEAITEGGITRFMALFDQTLPPKAGPVRSARQVFVDIAQEYTPVSTYYTHAGGAANALAMLKDKHLYDLDGLTIGSPIFKRFPRAGIASEHTLYTFPDQLYQLAASRQYSTDATFQSWKFKDDADISTRPDAQTIDIPFSSALFEVKYVYDKTSNSYKRFLAGTEHRDANNNQQLAPKNVIVQFASYAPLPGNKKGVQQVGIVGSGTAKIFLDGKVIDAKWTKATSASRTIFTDAATNQEVEFNRGQIWVEIPKIGTTITVK